MSRSKRKPYYGNAESAKWWKKHFNHVIRRKNIDISDGNEYKKLNEIWDSAMENKRGYENVPKMRRK